MERIPFDMAKDEEHLFNRSLLQELEEAFSTGSIHDYELPNPELVIRAIEHTYIEGEPRAWWIGLKSILHRQYVDHAQSYIEIKDKVQQYGVQHIRTDQKLLFIIDEDNEQHHVYTLTWDEIVHVIGQCRFFEYYICPDDYSWLLCENEHGEFLFCKRSSF